MTVQQFKAWLDEHILYLGGLDEFRNESEVVEQICDEGYRHAAALNLTDCVTAWQPGLLGLMAMRDAVPGPMSPKEAADKLGVSKELIYKLCDDDTMPHDRVGKRITITPEQLAEYQKRQPVGEFRHI